MAISRMGPRKRSAAQSIRPKPSGCSAIGRDIVSSIRRARACRSSLSVMAAMRSKRVVVTALPDGVAPSRIERCFVQRNESFGEVRQIVEKCRNAGFSGGQNMGKPTFGQFQTVEQKVGVLFGGRQIVGAIEGASCFSKGAKHHPVPGENDLVIASRPNSFGPFD